MHYGLVVLADPYPSTLEGLRQMLETVGGAVVMVAEGGALLKTVEQMRPDLVVVDFSLLVSGKKSVIQLLKKHSPSTKFIVMSMDADEALVHAVMSEGAEGFILKRRVAIDLLPSLRAVFQGTRFISPDVETSENWNRKLNNIKETKPEIDRI